jgi:LysM repeat protein
MTQPHKGSEKQDPLRKLRLRLRLERAIFAAVVLVLILLYLGALPGGRRVCLVSVDGEPVAILPTRTEAERLLDELKGASGFPPGEISFAQTVTLHSVSAARNPSQSYREAMDALSSALQPTARAAAILANGELVVALPDQGQAVRTLSLLLKQLSPPEPDVSAYFKEQVKVEMCEVPAHKLVLDADEAVQSIADEAAAKADHKVERGESAWKIARQYNVSLRRLAHANPDVDLESLRSGATLKIPGTLPPITVVARREIEEEVVEGIYRRTRRTRITYENGMEVKREVIGGQRPEVSVPPPGPYREPWRWRDEITQ